MRASLFFFFFTMCSCYKILIFAPDISNSQVIWNKRVADELAQAGHNVTVVLVQSMEDAEKDVQFSKGVNVYPLNASTGVTRKSLEQFQEKMVYGDVSLWSKEAREHMNIFFGMLLGSCEKILQNKQFMKWLIDQKFDLAFSHMYHTCPIGLVHAAKIPTWIWLNRMVPNKETQIFRNHWDPQFPDMMDLMRNCPLVMVNSNELYELPRPTLAKVVNIGGVGVDYRESKPLEGKFKKIADTGKGMVVMSFGSVAQAELMPEHWKTALLSAFARFPDYEFIIKYASDDLKDRLPKNVHTHRWLPQADLLLHPNTKAFISHGGYNSLQESIKSGVPLITVALFGDQFKNSKIAAKHGFAVNIQKATLDEKSVVDALKEVLNNDKYLKNAKRLSLMVRKKPVSPTHLLVKWTEFLAEFKTLENLIPAGNNLNFFQYFSLDVIAALLLVAFSVIYIVFKLLLLIICCFRSRGKKEKKE